MNWTPEEQAANRAKWVAALRSGDYEQATGVLTRERSDGTRRHCCLGVACDLAAAEGVVSPAEPHPDAGPDVMQYGPGHYSILPHSVRDWLGLSTEESANGHIAQNDCLSMRNDNGQTFTELADVIESGKLALA